MDLDEIKSILACDPDDGIFTWKYSRGSRAKKGSPAGTPNNGYMRVLINKKFYYLHRLALEFNGISTEGLFVDHINGDRSDNSLNNLRVCTPQQNPQNIRAATKASSSGILGVWFCNTRKKWHSQLRVGGRRIFVGYFDSSEEAQLAYLEAKREYHKFCTI